VGISEKGDVAMDVKKKGKFYYARYRQSDGVEFAASIRTPFKRVAVGIVGAIDRAVRTRDYTSLDPEAREVATRLFKDKLDDYLPGLRKMDNHERGMSLWESMQYCLTYPEVATKGHGQAEKQGLSIRLIPLDSTKHLRSMERAHGLGLVPEAIELIPTGTTVEFICLTNETAKRLKNVTVQRDRDNFPELRWGSLLKNVCEGGEIIP
jgi:hypothetical protein